MTATTPVRLPDAAVPPVLEDFSPEEVLDRLSRIDILRALPPEEMQELVPHVDFARLPRGTVLMRQGEPGDALYFIETGEARVERPAGQAPVFVGAGSVVGEAALLTGERRSASVLAERDLEVWVVPKLYFDQLVQRSPVLKQALQLLMDARRSGTVPVLPSEQWWVSTALRAIDARYRGLKAWQRLMFAGFGAWIALYLNERFRWIDPLGFPVGVAVAQLVTGMLIVQGACEAFVHGVERLGARKRWDGFISGTAGSLVSTLPEFVVVAFLVKVDPLAAFVTAAVTIFNNALVFSVYAFFLPKDRKGVFAMPRSLTIAGGEILVAGATVALLVGIVMLVLRVSGTATTTFRGLDLIAIGLVLMAIYAYYMLTLVRYYAEGKDDEESLPPDPERLGHDTSWGAIISMFALGMAGAYCAGEAIGAFAETALDRMGLPTIPTAAALAFFAGVSEYIIVYKAHRRGELGIALSNTFGGLTQVMFLLLPFSMLVIGIMGVGGDPRYGIPLNEVTMMLMLLLFPLFYALHQHMELGGELSNLDAASMTGIYGLLLYFLFTASP